MDKVKHILISLLVIFISFLFVDEDKTILFICDNLQIHLNQNQKSDLEIPHQHNLNKSHDDEIWMNSNPIELSCSSDMLSLFPRYLNKMTEDYTELIWQPPKSV
jgi:hypothetical protein